MRVIVLCDHGYVSGGGAQVAISSLNALAEQGLDVTFVSSVGPVAADINRDLVSVVNFGLHDLLGNPSRLQASIMGVWDSRCATRFSKLLEGFGTKDTIIHLHTWAKSLSPSVASVALRRGFKIVCTLHDYFAVCPNGGLYNFQQQAPCLLQPLSFDCITCNCDSRSYAQKLWRVGRQIVQNRYGGIPGKLKNFITVSDYSESLLRPWLPSTAKLYRVNNPIDIEKQEPSIAGGNSVFSFVGRISSEKGPHIFGEAARLAGVRSVFVGAGPMEESVAIVNPSAEFLGWHNRSGVIQAIRSSRAIVFPSMWHETQGMAVWEAAALGVPAIVSDSCAAREAIVDGETGLSFLSGNAADLATRLVALARDPDLATRLGLTAYERYWHSPSTKDMHVKQLIACYEDIMRDD